MKIGSGEAHIFIAARHACWYDFVPFIECRGFRVENLSTTPITLISSGIEPGRDPMGNHDQLEYATATGNDYVAHEEMYRRFCTLTMDAIAAVALILIVMAIFLT